MAAASKRNGSPPSQVTPSTHAASMTAETMRSWRLLIWRWRPSWRAGSARCPAPTAAEAALARCILRKRLGEMLAREIGPVAGQEHEFAVGGLPEQEIRKPQFAAGADDEIRIGNAVRCPESPQISRA